MTAFPMITTDGRDASASTPTRPVDDHGPWRGAAVLAVVTLAGFGFLYSMVGVGIGQALFPAQADGSLLQRGGRVVGSALLAQPFAGDGYFQPRPSAAGYDPMALSGSNQARTHPDLRKRIDEARAAVAQRDGVAPAAVPGDLVTQSGGGADPHVSPQGAAIQVERVARTRGLPRGEVERLVAAHTEGRQWGVFGEPRVHVLSLNLALDELGGRLAGGPRTVAGAAPAAPSAVPSAVPSALPSSRTVPAVPAE